VDEAARKEAERLAAVEAKWIAMAAERKKAEEKQRLALEEGNRAAARRFKQIAEEARLAASRKAAAPEPAAEIGDDEIPMLVEVVPAPAQAARPRVQKSAADTLVMIADDSKVVRVKTNRLLGNHQFQVQQAADGLDAVRQIAERQPDLVITDVEMPGMDGFELTRHLRANPATADVPVIMITGEDSYGAQAADAGVDVVLGKPYPEEDLIAHIQRLLRDGRGA
jgi:CheY-like chemotaxis protein